MSIPAFQLSSREFPEQFRVDGMLAAVKTYHKATRQTLPETQGRPSKTKFETDESNIKIVPGQTKVKWVVIGDIIFLAGWVLLMLGGILHQIIIVDPLLFIILGVCAVIVGIFLIVTMTWNGSSKITNAERVSRY